MGQDYDRERDLATEGQRATMTPRTSTGPGGRTPRGPRFRSRAAELAEEAKGQADRTADRALWILAEALLETTRELDRLRERVTRLEGSSPVAVPGAR